MQGNVRFMKPILRVINVKSNEDMIGHRLCWELGASPLSSGMHRQPKRQKVCYLTAAKTNQMLKNAVKVLHAHAHVPFLRVPAEDKEQNS